MTMNSKDAIVLKLPIAPVPASRPRVTRWGTYYLKKYKAYREEAEKVIPNFEHPLQGALTVSATFFCHRPKTTKRFYPRGDIDNFEKAVFDALTQKGFWEDDDQITTTDGVKKRFVPEGQEPYTLIVVRPDEDFL